MAFLAIPTVSADRFIGTNVILNIEQFDATMLNTSNNIRVLSANDDVPQFMSVSGNVDLKNWFYWLITIPAIPPIVCIVDIIQPLTRNYTYSINIPLEYTINASNLTWAEIRGTKSFQNVSLTSLLSGLEQFDVPYDDSYTITVYGNTSGGTCNAIAAFIVDRTSEFQDKKVLIVGMLILTLFGAAFYTHRFSRELKPVFKILTSVLAFLFVYSALSITLLAEREYVKLSSVNETLGSIFSGAVYIAIVIAFIILLYFVLNTINSIMKEKRRIRFGE